ncbi:MAG: glycine cleavage system protein GcvH [Candidatus Altiarchaeales archaeon]|nr:glycine cleavage system protein GcvH [Candidatus Altiarchaeota archaeon]MBU4341765.1 glycine cleavage system protein GcvH [Candidatus Altiarchaeota archaeon]MBU4406663.1 glycine cleavage system protein GcvH [Candidatus Altiarchaeota archaeon]MBU4437647.1 glycine cleavage system protein GcvH [Candidatus Altiarchaeota archaeon]MCG2782194.1 glycine cleavage system protein GcvH [Candidatus Altiarchaeales archaeon]
MDVEGYNMPDDLYYHKEYMWAKVEGNVAVVGFTDFAQKMAGDVSYVEMPFDGDEVSQDSEVGTIETGKWVGKMFAPVSGKVSATNEKLYDDPTIINKDPYGEGWVFKIEMSSPDDVNNLMKGEAAAEWQKGEIEKHK